MYSEIPAASLCRADKLDGFSEYKVDGGNMLLLYSRGRGLS